jgi:hypothetical protein
MTGVRLDRQGFVTEMSRITRLARNPRAVMLASGRRAGNELRKNFRRKDATEPNRLGGKRTRFWLQLARSVQSPVLENPTTVTVDISDPRTRQKVEGGPITAKRAKNLAIPQTAEAYGRAPAVFEQETGLKLFFIRTRGAGVLATRRSLYGTQVEYILKRSVKQDADPTALPDERLLEAAIIETAQATLDRQLKGGNL